MLSRYTAVMAASGSRRPSRAATGQRKCNAYLTTTPPRGSLVLPSPRRAQKSKPRAASSQLAGQKHPDISGKWTRERRPALAETMMAASAGGEEYHQYGTPHGLLVAVVLGLLIAGPLFLGEDGGEAIKEAVKELLSPVGLLLLPVGLVIVIRVLSSDRGPAAFTDVFNFGGTPDTVHRVGASPVGVALFLLLIVMLLYYRSALFFGDGRDDE